MSVCLMCSSRLCTIFWKLLVAVRTWPMTNLTHLNKITTFIHIIITIIIITVTIIKVIVIINMIIVIIMVMIFMQNQSIFVKIIPSRLDC